MPEAQMRAYTLSNSSIQFSLCNQISLKRIWLACTSFYNIYSQSHRGLSHLLYRIAVWLGSKNTPAPQTQYPVWLWYYEPVTDKFLILIFCLFLHMSQSLVIFSTPMQKFWVMESVRKMCYQPLKQSWRNVMLCYE